MHKLSVVLAVYNEEENLDRCLASVKNLADEIVIVDGGSVDSTVEIAKKHNARIIRADNPPVFHINKNKAIDAANCEWILQLDADEVVSDELSREIKKKIQSNTNVNGYWLPRRNFFLDRFLKKGGQYPDYILRLFKNGKGRLPGKDVHEQVVAEGQTEYFKNDLLHLRDKNFSIYMRGFNRYTDLLADQIKSSGIKPSFITMFSFMFWKPAFWFLKAYFRHKGFVDGFPGFVFALFSSFRFPAAYIKMVINKGRAS